MKWFKFLAGVTVVSAAGAAIAAKTIRDKKRQAELDEFLMPETDDMVVLDIPTKHQKAKDKMEDDILDLANRDVTVPVNLHFKFEHFKEAHEFAEELSETGLSSSLSDEDRTVTIQYRGEINSDSLLILTSNLNSAINTKDIYYQGCDFTK